MTLSLAGLGALLGASATLFAALKFAGAAYPVWLAIRLRRALVGEEGRPPVGAGRAVRDAYVVTAPNPKSIAFFLAFVPLFVDPAAPFLQPAATLVASVVALAALNAGLHALLAARLSAVVRRPATRRAFNRTGGALLVGAGLATAAIRRPA